MSPADRERQIKGLLDYLPREKQIEALRELKNRTLNDVHDRALVDRLFHGMTELESAS